jgi:hypothetical protein
LNWLDANMPGNCYNVTQNEWLIRKPELLAFPNPASDHVFIELPAQNENAVIRVYTLAGNLLQIPFTFDGNLFRLDVQQLPVGMYYARITGSNHACSNVKLIIAR